MEFWIGSTPLFISCTAQKYLAVIESILLMISLENLNRYIQYTESLYKTNLIMTAYLRATTTCASKESSRSQISLWAIPILGSHYCLVLKKTH